VTKAASGETDDASRQQAFSFCIGQTACSTKSTFEIEEMPSEGAVWGGTIGPWRGEMAKTNNSAKMTPAFCSIGLAG
jgi:hypothetical protein